MVNMSLEDGGLLSHYGAPHHGKEGSSEQSLAALVYD